MRRLWHRERSSFLACVLLLPALPHAQAGCVIETFAGGYRPPPETDGPALQTTLRLVRDGAVAADGTVYFTQPNAVRRLTPEGFVETILSAEDASWIDLGPDGSVYFKDDVRIRRILPSGEVVTVAGNGGEGSPQDGRVAAEAPHLSRGLAVGPDGSLYLVEPDRHRVRRVGPDGRVSLVAGSTRANPFGGIRGGFAGDGGPAVEAELNQPRDVAIGPDGSLYVTDGANRRIRRIGPDGVIRTIAGGGARNIADGVSGREVTLNSPDRIAVDAQGRVYFSHGSFNVYRVDPDGSIRLASENGASGSFFLAPDGSLFHFSGGRLFRRAPSGQTASVAGVGEVASPELREGPALGAPISPRDLEFGPSGDLYVANGNRVIEVSADGVLRFVAGGGGDSRIDDVSATSALLVAVSSITVDPQERVYLSEFGIALIRRVDRDGTLRRVAGKFPRDNCPANLVCGVGGPAPEAALADPRDLFAASDGSLWFVDKDRGATSTIRTDRIYRITPGGMLEQSPETQAMRERSGDYSIALAGSAQGRLFYVFEYAASPFRPAPPVPFYELRPDGVSIPLPATQGYANPWLHAASAEDGSIYFATEDFRVRKALPDGRVATIAGVAGQSGFAGDGGPAREALLGPVRGLALGPDGALYIADSGRIRRILDVASCDDSARPQIAIGGAVHAADFRSLDYPGTAPGMIVSIFGRGLASGGALTARVDDGRLTTELGGVRVLFDGEPGPLAFVSANQVNAIAPYGIEARSDVDQDGREVLWGRSRVEVEVDGELSEPAMIRTRATQPGVFLVEPGVSQRGAVFHGDGTLNGPRNPARIGSVLTLFGTGEGQTDPPGVDGLLATAALPTPVAPVSIRIGDTEATVLYAGAAPGFTAGLFQANARIEPGTPSGEQQLTLRIGDSATSVPVWVAR